MQHITIGSVVITALTDGSSRLPPVFFPGLDPCRHDAGMDADGTVHIPTGCFLVRGAGRTILVDAGLGPITLPMPNDFRSGQPDGFPSELSEGGQLPAQLKSAGCEPDDIDTVLLTHLHGDHVGWVAPNGEPYFRNATVLLGEGDWEPLVEEGLPEDPGVQGLKAARDAGRIETLSATSHHISAGVDVEHAPGHTPGSYVAVVSSAGEKAYLLGDVVQHPLQLDDSSISFLTDADVVTATRTRQALLARLEEEQAAIGMNHFPGSTFQRIVSGSPRMWRTAS